MEVEPKRRLGSVRSDGSTAARKEEALPVIHTACDCPTYTLSFSVAATAALDIFSLVAGTNKVLRVRKIVLVNPGAATGAIIVDLQLGTAAAVGSAGAAGTPQPVDPVARVAGVSGGPDGAFSGISGAAARTGDTTQAGSFVATHAPLCSVSVPAAAAGFTPLTIYDSLDPTAKGLTVAGATQPAVLRTPSVGAGATGLRGYVLFTVDDA
jgi:hypothetical protein